MTTGKKMELRGVAHGTESQQQTFRFLQLIEQ